MGRAPVTSVTEFDRLWDVEYAAALAQVRAKAHLDRGVSHELLASMRAFQQITGRLPTEGEVATGPAALRLRAFVADATGV